MQIVDKAQVDALFESNVRGAVTRGRLLVVGKDRAEDCHRMLFGMQPGAYVRPHRHPAQWELFVCLHGSADLLNFSGEGELLQRIEMGRERTLAVEDAPNSCHGIVALEPDTLFLMIKPGANRPSEFATWSPTVVDSEANHFVEWSTTAHVGDWWQGARTGHNE